jgi:hypothetical protein
MGSLIFPVQSNLWIRHSGCRILMNCSEAASSTSKKPRKSQSSRHSANSRASALHVLNIRYFGCPVPEHRIPLQGLAYRLRSGWARAVRFVYSVCVSSPDRSRCSASAETPSGRHPGFAVGDVNVSSLRGSVAARERTCSLRVPLLPCPLVCPPHRSQAAVRAANGQFWPWSQGAL